jgi:CheY-like chemotaxis protein
VVEDDPDVLNLVDILLANLNYRTIRATTGQEALEVLNGNESPDLLLTDVIFPGGMTGVEIAKEAAKTGREIPVIFMSGYTENSIIHQGVLDQGVLLLNKPFRKFDLANMLRRALEDGGTGSDA